MSGYRIVKATRCEEAQRRMIDYMVRQIKEVMPRHDTVILNLVTLKKDCDINKALEERLRERMPDVEVTVSVGNATELIIRCKRKEHFPTLMWKDIKELKEEDK